MAVREFSKKALRIGIVEFFEWAGTLNIKNLSPVQKMTLKLMAGEKLDEVTPIKFKHAYGEESFANEVEMFKFYSDKDSYEHKFYNDINLLSGRRSGKSTTIAAGAALYFATQFDYAPYLGTSPHATLPLISNTKEQANEIYVAIKNMLLRSPYLYETFLDGDITRAQEEYGEDELDGRFMGGQIKLNQKVIIKVLAADIAKLRGMACIGVVLDECCFFGVDGNDTKNTDKGIFEAILPSLSQFSQVEGLGFVLKISSPSGQSGIMFQDYLKRKDDDILHLQIPSWIANTSLGKSYLEKQKKKGMNFFNREYGAEYTASETSYLDPVLIEHAIIRGTDELSYQKGYRYAAMIDYATRNDYWTLAIGHKEYITDIQSKDKVEKVYCDVLMHWRGSDGAELDPSEVVTEICHILKQYQVPFCLADQYAFGALKPLFAKDGIVLKEFTLHNSSKIKMMYSLQVALNTKNLLMVHNPIAVQHLKDLRERKSHISNKVQIAAANNSHDDYAIVIAGVIYQFDKTSPIYIGYSRDEDEDAAALNKDANGNFISTPTAQDMADIHGISAFYDGKKAEDQKDGTDEDEDLWFCI